jgi:hypothetical protein
LALEAGFAEEGGVIRELTEEDLPALTDEDLAEAIREHQPEADREAVAAIVALIRLPQRSREQVLKYIRSYHIMCPECGRPSCLHGYPDD